MDAPVREGEVLAGKYRVEHILGVGGMGVVVSAMHLQLEERVALKFLRAEALANPELVARLVREARAAAKIKNEHVARIIDVGSLENGSPYLVMEYLDGQDLATVIRTQGALQLEIAVEIILQTCEALAEAHGHGIIHRDLKPANLFLVRTVDGSLCAKVLDFGISKMRTGGVGGDMSITRTAAIMGSPAYMSPEQLTSSRDVDARSDLWALGVILYEMLTGVVPFRADTIPELCVRILQEAPPPIAPARPDLPFALQKVLFRCLEKDRNQRPASVAEFAQDLAPFAPRRALASVERIGRVVNAGGAARSGSLPGAVGTQPATHNPTGAAWGTTANPKIRRPSFWIGIGAAALVATAAAGFLAMRYRASETVTTASAPSALTSSTHLGSTGAKPPTGAAPPASSLVEVLAGATALPAGTATSPAEPDTPDAGPTKLVVPAVDSVAARTTSTPAASQNAAHGHAVQEPSSTATGRRRPVSGGPAKGARSDGTDLFSDSK